MREKLQKFIDSIEFPIHVDGSKPPRQLVLRKNSELVQAYDPVYEIESNEASIKIKGFLHTDFIHNFGDFNKIEIINHSTEEVLQEFYLTDNHTLEEDLELMESKADARECDLVDQAMQEGE